MNQFDVSLISRLNITQVIIVGGYQFKSLYRVPERKNGRNNTWSSHSWSNIEQFHGIPRTFVFQRRENLERTNLQSNALSKLTKDPFLSSSCCARKKNI